MYKNLLLKLSLIALITYPCYSQNFLPGSNSINSMKIISYNLFYGLTLSPGKTGDNIPQQEKFINWILIENPDIVAYQELGSKYNTVGELEQLASNINHSYAYVWDRGGKQAIGISSKWEMELIEGDNTYDGFAIYKIKNEPYYFIITHLSSSSINARKNESNLIISKYEALIANGNHVVILGDFNSMASNDSEYANNNISERLKERFDKGNKFNSEINCSSTSELATCDWDYSVMPKYFNTTNKLIDLVDSYANKHSYESAKMWGTFPSKAAAAVHTKAQRSRHLHRIDFILSNEELSTYTLDARIVHNYVNSSNESIEMDTISDHYPVVVHLGVNQTTSKSSNSDIIFNSNFETPKSIIPSNYKATELVAFNDEFGNGDYYDLTQNNAIKVASFILRDGGENGDSDELPTVLNHFNLEINNFDVIDKIAIYHNNKELDERKVNHNKVSPNSKIAFSNLGIIASDNQQTVFDIWVTFNNPINESKQFKIQIENAMSDYKGSHFNTINAGGASSSTLENENTVISEGLNFNSLEQLPFLVYPNPTKNVFNLVSHSNNAKVIIMSTDGKKIFNQTINKGNKSFNMSDFKKGTYILNYISNNNSHSELLLKL